MSDTAFTERDPQTGVVLKIERDDSPSNPLGEDSAVRFAVLHRQYENPAKADGLTSPEAIAEFEAENAGEDSEWVVFPLFMIDHSGTAYAPSHSATSNPFSCPWDSGRVGVIALKRSEFGAEANHFDLAKDICKTYTDWANGNAWGWIVENAEGDHLDSCWGYIGDHDDDYLMGEAREAFDRHKANVAKDQAAMTARQVKLADKLAADCYFEGEAAESILGRLRAGKATGEDFQAIAEQLAELEDA